MNLPVWEIPFAGAELPRLAAGAVLSAAAYFTAGGALLVALLEHRAHREGNQPLLSFLQDWSRFLLLMATILGGAMAAGLWLTAAVTEPSAVHALTLALFWVWGALWALGVVLLAAILLHYSGWGAMPPVHHLAVGWIAVGAAWCALFASTGIEAFLLAPGRWPETGKLLDGFFNETFSPVLLGHAGLALGIGGLFTMVAAAQAEPVRLRIILVRTAGWVALAGFLLTPLGALWLTAVISPEAREAAVGPLGSGRASLVALLGLSAAISLVLATGPLPRPEGAPRAQALLLLCAGLAAMGADGWLRRSVRGSDIVPGTLLANGIDPRQLASLRVTGFLARARYAPARGAGKRSRAETDGAALFRLQCAGCHTVSGYRGVRRLVQGWDLETLDRQLSRLEKLRGRMPPFAGTAAERRALAKWLAQPSAGPADPGAGPR